MKKKILAVLVSLALIFALGACSKESKDSSSNVAQVSNVADKSKAEYANKLFSKEVLKIEITTKDEDWNNLIENAATKPTIRGDISIEGETFKNVAIKTKGNTSLKQIAQTGSNRYSLKINFDKYEKDQTCYGLDKLVLNNIYADTTYMKEYMSYNLFQFMDVPSSLCTFADIYVNGEHYGFYLALEDTDSSFIDRNYGTENNVEAYKPESMEMGGDKGNFGDMQRPDNMQGGAMPNMDITKFIKITDKDGKQVNWSDIGAGFDFDNVESITTSKGKTTKISDIDMKDIMSIDISTIVSITDSSGKKLDLSKYTLSIQDFGNMQPPDMLQGNQQSENNSPNENNQPPQRPAGEEDNDSSIQGGMQRPDGKNGGGMDGGKGGVSLVYSDDNIDSYSNIFDNAITKTNEEDQKRLISSLKGISEGENLEDYINVDEVLRYTACNVFLVNLDSYFSSMGHNYILAEDNGILSMLPWDYNLSFATYQGTSASDAVNYAIDSVFSGIDAEQRPIISKLLEKEEYKEKYHEYLRQIAEKYVESGIFTKTIDNVNSAINEYVKNDTTSFNSYEDYTAGIEMLKTFGTLRAKSIIEQLDGKIPSTKEEQTKANNLIDASSLDLSKLGTMNMGQKGGNNMPMHNENGNVPFANSNTDTKSNEKDENLNT